ncbi:MAG: hypothetical protein WCJ97_07945 [Phycisphaerae bacterium]
MSVAKVTETLVFPPGTKVRLTQQIPQHGSTCTTVIEGTVVRQERQPSGSWFARNPLDKLWLDRLIIQKADGEKSVINLDALSHVEVLGETLPVAGSSPMVAPAQDRSSSIT